jgi:hypothetical protein
MRLNKNSLSIIGIIPIVFGLVIFYNFLAAIDLLRPGGMTTSIIYYQLLAMSTAMLLGASLYWGILVYYVYLMQENEVFIQDNFTLLAGSGTAHLKNAKRLISKVLDNVKSTELKPQQ